MSICRKMIFLLAIAVSTNASAQLVKYDEGAIYANGLTFLQDAKDSTRFYYLPKYPRLSIREDGGYEFVCIKYVGDKPENSGGLFHALIDFAIPDTLLKSCEVELGKIVPGAKVMGQVPL